MQPGLPEAARRVEADPGAVFERHGAESVDELVASGEAPERDDVSDRAVSSLFEGALARPERQSVSSGEGSGTPTAGEPSSGVDEESATESTTTPAVLADLKRAIDETEADAPGAVDGEELDALDDAEVAEALAIAEELETADAGEVDCQTSIPAEWRED
ncbi:hypothetical protein [Salinarchaeum laminariae]|uniref:hypothetical protein n=1 Tax=Salinarchaeum laminariae TaxID=869888 RepID=UPI0020BF0A2E|nr:hypothetical protein [Salinarchaeum laminariae]